MSNKHVLLPDGTWATRVQIAGAEDSGSGGALGTNIKGAESIVPVDIQARLSKTEQTHSGVTVAPSSNNSSAWIDTDGFGEIAVTIKNDSATANGVVISYSHDGGTTLIGEETLLASGATQNRAGITSTKARYCRVLVLNFDTVPHVLSAWAYLKA